MQEHSHDAHQSHNNSGVLMRHLILLLVIIVVGVGLYALTADLSVITTATILFILAHILAVGIVVYGGRSFFTTAIRKFHGVPEPQTQSHAHSHDFKTTGATISWAGFYDFFVRYVLMGQYQKMLDSTLKLAAIQAGESVLEIGCGTGTLAIAAKKASPAGAVIHATDASPEMIERAQQKAATQGIAVNFEQGLAERIDAPDASYDLVMNSLMVHHLPDELRVKAFAEVFRVLKSGGRLLIVDFEPPKNRFTRAWLSLTPMKAMLQIDNSIILPVLEAAGFEHIEMRLTDSKIAVAISARKP